ncbi:hypothetical protein F5884DRAFT_360353 [Xylogone sp. PMI_703]|nr:hypothetical protein F5884DRAFT_360353 [Xylogone sp. PMI_703]
MDQASRVNIAQKVIVDLLTLREAQRATARTLASLSAAHQASTPPPAYQDIYNSNSTRNNQGRQAEMNHPQAHLFDPHHRPAAAAEGYSSYEDADETTPPSISINITSSLSITGSNNVIGMDTGRTAATIARALVDAIKTTSMSAMGIPMIDEEGKPRTINVVVDAGMKVDGNDNIVGEDVAKMRMEILRKRDNQDRKNKIKESDSESETSQEASVTDAADDSGSGSGSGSGSEGGSKAEDGDETEEQQSENEDERENQDEESKEGTEDAEDSTTVVESIEQGESSGDDLAPATRKRGPETFEGLNIMMDANSKRPRFH